MRGSKYSDQTRAQAIATLLTGQAVEAVAARYALPVRTVRDWARRDAPAALAGAPLLTALVTGYLEESLTTLAAQVRAMRDPVWLHQQHADDLAVLHGVLTDKAIRILAAAEAADSFAPNSG